MKLCDFEIGLAHPIFLIAGPCVIESEQLQMDVAGQLKEITASLGVPFIFKSSFDKANRSSGSSGGGSRAECRGVGEGGLWCSTRERERHCSKRRGPRRR